MHIRRAFALPLRVKRIGINADVRRNATGVGLKRCARERVVGSVAGARGASMASRSACGAGTNCVLVQSGFSLAHINATQNFYRTCDNICGGSDRNAGAPVEVVSRAISTEIASEIASKILAHFKPQSLLVAPVSRLAQRRSAPLTTGGGHAG
jgi:hypothetical protein